MSIRVVLSINLHALCLILLSSDVESHIDVFNHDIVVESADLHVIIVHFDCVCVIEVVVQVLNYTEDICLIY